MSSFEQGVERFEQARRQLNDLLSSDTDPPEDQLSILDLQLAQALDALLDADLSEDQDVFRRIRFLIAETQQLANDSMLAQRFSERILLDLTVLQNRYSDHTSTIDGGVGSSVQNEGDLFELCYSSKARGGIGSDDIQQIKEEAQTFNESNKITGFLTFDEQTRCFFQILEGSETSLNILMNRIIKDTRHSEIDIRFQSPISYRHFSHWAMHVTTTSQIQGGLQNGEALESWMYRFLGQETPPSSNRGYRWLIDSLSPLMTR